MWYSLFTNAVMSEMNMDGRKGKVSCDRTRTAQVVRGKLYFALTILLLL